MKPSRRLRRFFSSSELPPTGEACFLPCDETRHIKKILRLQEGDQCLVINGAGQEAEAQITYFLDDGRTQLKIERIVARSKRGQRYFLRIYQAIPQRGKMDYLVEKAQEWGVQEIRPIETERTVVKMSEENKAKAVARWAKIARQAAKQSGALDLVEIYPPALFSLALGAVDTGNPIVLFHPAEDAVPFRDWIRTMDQKDPGKKPTGAEADPLGQRFLNLFLGPEGGFTDREVESAASKGAVKVHLGKNILKVDTAFIGIISALKLILL